MRPSLVLAAVCVGWGTIPLIATEVELPAAAIVFCRVWIAAAGLGLILSVRREAGASPLRERPARCIAVGVTLAAHWTAMFAAYGRAPAATVIFVVFLAPIGIAVAERASPRLVVALAVALAGLALVVGPSLDANALGVVFALASAATFVALVLLAKPLAEAYGGLRLTFLEMVVAGVALLPIAAFVDWGEPRAAWGWLVVLGLAHTAFGTAIYLWALARMPATEVGILGYLEPVGVVVFAWLVRNESPSLSTIVGGALVVAAGALVVLTSEVPTRVPG